MTEATLPIDKISHLTILEILNCCVSFSDTGSPKICIGISNEMLYKPGAIFIF
jgi:hypothetical protein